MNVLEILLEIPKDEEHPDEVLTNRIGTLHAFNDTNFANPDDYTGEAKIWLDEFMKIKNIEKRKDAVNHAVNELHAKLMSLDVESG